MQQALEKYWKRKKQFGRWGKQLAKANEYKYKLTKTLAMRALWLGINAVLHTELLLPG